MNHSFVFRKSGVQMGFRPTDRPGDMPELVENRRPDVEDKSGVGLNELIQISECHAGDSSRFDGGLYWRICRFRLGWIERWNRLCVRIGAGWEE